ncbi:carboxylesterase/lipase family protein [Streptomyces lateritius]|uniref:Carboxylic ester hydrolase n=1 Tax=Streptomyces lateritius TaxID=67313 RepID=A0ABW6YIS5_9ACTN
MGTAAADETVTTKQGTVRGRNVDGLRITLGIPYAAPPFGPGRFQAPRPAEAWDGVRDGTRFGPVAPQSAELPGAPVWRPGQEDVLTLNVWSPADAPGPLPVLFWIHGGAYTFGSSAQPDHDGAALARAGLTVVTCNYRLGFEGFGHVPGRPDNRGLLDQIAALEWVRDNISAFGGDPDNVTVAGQSSGGGSITCLMSTGRAEGLFRRAVTHSVPDATFPPALAAALAQEVAAEAGVAPTAEGLLSATPQALVEASDRVVARYASDPSSGPLHYDTVIYGPVLDDALLPKDPVDALAAGSGGRVDLLVCHATEEYWLMHEVGSMPSVTTEEGLARFAADYGLPPELVARYRAHMPGAPVLDVYLALAGDALFTTHTVRLAEAHAHARVHAHGSGGGRVFLSRFDRRRGRPDGSRVRAWHAADVPFALGTLDAEGVDFLTGGPAEEDDRALSRRMVRAWADFATHGDPGWAPLTDPSAPTVHVWDVPADREEGASPAHALWRGLRAAPLPTPPLPTPPLPSPPPAADGAPPHPDEASTTATG